MERVLGKTKKESRITRSAKRKITSGCIAGVMLLESMLPFTSFAASNSLGTTIEEGDYKEFSYQGSVETFIAPITGKYKLEVWGAEGGAYDSTTAGGDGGYSSGEIILSAGEELYICVGGQGGVGANGGYNGGGSGTVKCGRDNDHGGAGGGATHIAIDNNRGTLNNYESYKSEVLIVAGGGGGASESHDEGGTGGGTNGGGGYGSGGIIGIGNSYPGAGGTQTEGGAPGKTDSQAGSFGKGGDAHEGAGGWTNSNTYGCGGGGGGWYGGGAACHVTRAGDNYDAAGGGGSGYVNENRLTNTSTENGQNTGAGKAKITLVELPTIEISAIYNDGNVVVPTVTLKIDDEIISDTEYTYTYDETIYAGESGQLTVSFNNSSFALTENFTVERKPINRPDEIAPVELEYNGTTQDVSTIGEDYQYYDISGDYTGKDAGNYVANLSLKDTANTYWTNESKDDYNLNWSITPKEIAVTWSEEDFTYNKQGQAPSVTTPVEVVAGETVNIIRTTNINVGNYEATASIDSVDNGLVANYTLTNASKSYNINEKSISDSSITATLNEYTFTYDGTAKTPSVTSVLDSQNGDTTLTFETDYNYSYINNTNAGTGIVRISGLGNYTETKDVEFTINPKIVTNPTVELSESEYTYDGTAHSPTVTVKDGETYLVEGTDFEVSYTNNTDAGTANVTVTGIGNYSITYNTTFTINKRTIAIPTGDLSLVYNGVTQNGVAEGEDYTLSGNSQIDVGDYTATATLNDNRNTKWEDETSTAKEISWKINPYTINVEWQDPRTFTYDKEGHAPVVVTPEEGPNGELVYLTRTTQIDVGEYISTASILNVVNGRENSLNYVLSSEQESFSINAKDIEDDTILVILSQDEYDYDGTAHSPTVTVQDNENGTTTLVENTDYTKVYKYNTNAGEAQVVITGIGNYIGENTLTFTINKINTINPTLTSVSEVYSGNPVSIETTGGEGGTVYYKTSDDNETWSEWSETVPSRTNAGTTYVKAYVEPDNNHNLVAETSVYTLTVEPKPLTLTAANQSKTYGAVDPELTYQVEGLVSGEALEGISITRAQGENAGEYGVTISQEAGSNSNYNVTINNAVFTINPKVVNATVELSQEEYLFNGEAFEPGVTVYDNATVIPEGEYTVTYTDNTEPGTAHVTISDKTGGNYTVTGAKDFTILETTNIAISGVTDGTSYYEEVEFTVYSDKQITSVTDNGEEIEPVSGKYKIAQDNSEHTIIARDILGGVAEITISVFKTYTVTFIADDTIVKTVENVKHGFAIEDIPEIPHKDGYDDVAPTWDKEVNSVTSDMEVKAVYTKNEPGDIAKDNTETKYDTKIEDNNKDLAEIVPFTDEEAKQIEYGKNAVVYVEVEAVGNEISEVEKLALEEKAKEDGSVIALILDISLYKKVGNNEPVKITETNGKITLSVEIPEGLINKDPTIARTYKIIMIHDGKVKVLDAVEKDGRLYFETDEFSTYAVAYKDEEIKKEEANKEEKQESKEKDTTNPKTEDNIYEYIIMFVIGVISTTGICLKRKEH